MRDGNVNMGAKFAHSAKSVKLGTHVHWTLLFDKINGSTLGNTCFRYLNPIWPPLDTPFGHNLINSWPIFIILVSIIWFSRAGSPSVRYFVTISKVSTKLQQDLIKYKQFSLQINIIRQHLTTATKDNDIQTKII